MSSRFCYGLNVNLIFVNISEAIHCFTIFIIESFIYYVNSFLDFPYFNDSKFIFLHNLRIKIVYFL